MNSDSYMNKAVIHEAEKGGFWAEVPAIPGCVTQGETLEELWQNLYEAVEGCLSINVVVPRRGRDGFDRATRNTCQQNS